MHAAHSLRHLVRIRVKGELADDWSDYFGPLDLAWESRPGAQRVTVLSGHIVDQSALIGMLNNLHGLSLNLLTIEYQSVSDTQSLPGPFL